MASLRSEAASSAGTGSIADIYRRGKQKLAGQLTGAENAMVARNYMTAGLSVPSSPGFGTPDEIAEYQRVASASQGNVLSNTTSPAASTPAASPAAEKPVASMAPSSLPPGFGKERAMDRIVDGSTNYDVGLAGRLAKERENMFASRQVEARSLVDQAATEERRLLALKESGAGVFGARGERIVTPAEEAAQGRVISMRNQGKDMMGELKSQGLETMNASARGEAPIKLEEAQEDLLTKRETRPLRMRLLGSQARENEATAGLSELRAKLIKDNPKLLLGGKGGESGLKNMQAVVTEAKNLAAKEAADQMFATPAERIAFLQDREKYHAGTLAAGLDKFSGA